MSSNAKLVRVFCCLLLTPVVASSAVPLKLREAVGTVASSASTGSDGQSLASGTGILPGSFVRTGADARADFVAGNGALRLGSQTTLHISDAHGEIDLERGTALFDDLPKDLTLTIRFDGEPVAVEGGTGFAILTPTSEGKPATLHVGSIAGRVTVRRAGKSLALSPAQVLSLTTEARARLGAFNLARQVASSVLVQGFQAPLPGIKNVRHEAERFASLERRGFVQTRSAPVVALNTKGTPASSVEGSGSGVHSESEGTFAAAISQASGAAAGIVEREGIGVGGQAAGRNPLAGLVDDFSFQSRFAVVARSHTALKGNNGIGNGVDPPPPGWLNPRNPHFGQPQNDGSGAGPGRGGNGHRR